MKNREKFKDEIVDIACNGGTLAVDIETNKPVDCNDTDCNKCLFHGSEFGSCVDVMKTWAVQEYKEPNVISRADIRFLAYIKDEYEYMARDENGNLYVHAILPIKYSEYGIWVGGDSINCFKFDIDFPMVKYSDEKAWKILDLKNLKVVENY